MAPLVRRTPCGALLAGSRHVVPSRARFLCSPALTKQKKPNAVGVDFNSMMHRLRRYDAFRFAQNDVAPLRFAMMR